MAGGYLRCRVTVRSLDWRLLMDDTHMRLARRMADDRMRWEAEIGRNDGVCKRQAQAYFHIFTSLDLNLHRPFSFLSVLQHGVLDLIDTIKQYSATGYSTAEEVSSSRQPSKIKIFARPYHQHCKLSIGLATRNAPVP